jgi:hypothetical protein
MKSDRRTYLFLVVLLALPSLLPGISRGDERLKGIACRSVHLFYPAPEGGAFYNEVTIDRSAEGTYFMVCGFSHGYFGIQELASGKKVVLFSVWDPGKQNDPRVVAEERRVKVVAQGEKVRVRRFGGEGTGGQSFFDLDWKKGQTYRFLVRARAAGPRTEYAAYLFLPDEKKWKHLVTFSTLSKGHLLTGYYSFIEDFRRNRISATRAREARFGNGWIQNKEGKWLPLTRARFTADRNPVMNINAKVVGPSFALATGGATANTTRLNSLLHAGHLNKPPTDLPR